MTAAAWPDTLPVAQVRIVRPTDKLSEVVTFYRDLLGLEELYRFEDYGGFDGVMLGLPGASYHLEFTTHVDGSPCPAPTNSNLLVLYFGTGAAMGMVVRRLSDAGREPVEPENPYWLTTGAVTFADPDGWRVVLVPQPAF
jgi:catechol 2,3-dioxygenase-like lactoylglutathione lyase family enzyme